MRIVYALVAVALVLFAFDKLPFASKRSGAPGQPTAAQPVGGKATTSSAMSSAPSASPAAKVVEAPRPTYVASRECVRTTFGAMNCREVTTLKP
ncbi:hypothetical protein [Rhodoplanes roseus]|uniref:Uncharacterized protein n=1 Tax=Rhodoplanes roseus TaxID=29409 RepID=A0A327L3M9_9BRAD|nr:hypothetical protein [Rhodoplanes roseus]RAI44102.1 hypothetical protein CH341_10985 [Rhodoplanes roseus]